MPADSFSRMDSNGSNNESNIPEMFGSSPGASSTLRQRTESESSDKNTLFILPNADGSPAKILTFDEVANVMKNIQNMTLAHEIVLNPDFKLQPYEPPENSLERRVKEIVHRAFWDSLREQLKSKPPCYDFAIQLLADIKELFPQILAQNNKRTLDYINEVLDASVIKQQAEQGVLDFQAYANFVIDIMAKSCAPARDEVVHALTKIDDVVDTFRGILETMTLMKLDMANYLLDSSRNTIMANSVEYEKNKFKEYLEYYKLGFPATEDWLKRNSPASDANNTAANPQNTAFQIIMSAYMELMDWNHENEFPEILSIDKDRVFKLGYRAKRLCVCASLISICAGVPIISQRPDNRVALAKQYEILLQDTTDENSITKAFEGIWLQTKKFINDALAKENQPPMNEASEDLLKSQIMKVDANGPVRQLMWKRLREYFTVCMKTKLGVPPPPSGFLDYKTELESYATSLKKVILYNHAVFGDYFVELLTKGQTNDMKPKTTTVNAAADNQMETVVASTSAPATGFKLPSEPQTPNSEEAGAAAKSEEPSKNE